jgi:hypothetical protein
MAGSVSITFCGTVRYQYKVLVVLLEQGTNKGRKDIQSHTHTRQQLPQLIECYQLYLHSSIDSILQKSQLKSSYVHSINLLTNHEVQA